MADGASEALVHGTAVALGDRAALLRGPSGAGKSDLALRTLQLPPGGPAGGPLWLVADDQVLLTRAGDTLRAAAPARLAGLIEVRGLGILAMPHVPSARLVLLVDLVASGQAERLPDPWPYEILAGVGLPVLKLPAFEASAPAKLALALGRQPWQEIEDD